jgi:microcystin-dependent protein
MATQLQFRRGTTAQNNSYTGLVGEISLDTSTNNIRIHDGSTGGGAEIIPSGTIVGYGAASAPTGWLLCDDSAVSRSTYARLFAVIGTGYGVGDGSSTFNVPDLRDKVPLGKGTNNGTLGTTTGSAGGSSVLASATKSGVTTAASNTGTGTTGSANTGTGTTGSGTSGSGTTGSGTSGNSTSTTVATNTAAAASTTAAANTGSGTTGTANTGTGNTNTTTTTATTTAADGDGDLTVSSVSRNDTLGSGTKDVSSISIVSGVNQASHTHTIPSLTVAQAAIPALSIPGLSIPALTIPSLTVNNHTHGIPSLTVNNHTHSVPGLSVPGLSVPGLSIPALSVPGLSIPALTVPSLTVNNFSVNTTLPTEVVNYIIKI